MVDHDRLIHAIPIFADNPTVLRAVGKNSIYRSVSLMMVKHPSPTSLFSFFVNKNSPLNVLTICLKILTITRQSVKRGAKLPGRTAHES